MKFNLKSCLAAVVLTISGILGSQAAELQFSTTASPVWYKVKFTTGGAYLSDSGSGSNLVTSGSADGNGQLWQLIGDNNSFTMRSKNGNYVNFSNNRFVSSSTSVKLYLTKSGANYEIGREGSDTHMNQWGGTGAGKELGEWQAGDNNNLLRFFDSNNQEATVNIEGRLPVFSTDASSTYYFMQWKRGGIVLASQGKDKSVLRANASPDNSQLWKVTGTRNNCQFVNKNGEYLVINGTGDGCVKTSASPYSPGFKLINTPNTDYPLNWEIQPNDAEKCFNMFGGNSVGGQFGLWDLGDVNNPMNFVLLEDMTFGEFPTRPSATYQPSHANTLWYTAPGTADGINGWMNWSLPIGNGYLGAQVMGGVSLEEISFTNKTLWSGGKDDHGGSNDSGYGTFEGFGNVMIATPANDKMGWSDEKSIKDYYRTLDISTAIASVGYKNSDASTEYTREFLASYPDGVIAMHFTATTPGAITLDFTVVPGVTTNHAITYANGTASFGGKLKTISYNSVMKVIPTGGSMTTDNKGIHVVGANELLVILGGDTDYDPLSPSYTKNTAELPSFVLNKVNAAAAKGWNAIRADHIADYQPIFNRVSLNIDGAKNDRTTLQLINQYNVGNGTASVCRQLEQLYFQYGRYLAICSNRGVDCPNNLQGIWSGFNRNRRWSGANVNPWNADIHANINIQMNYWPVEQTNLSEFHMPFLNYIINMATVQPQWHKNVTDYVSNPRATKGWTCFTENNIFGAGSSWGNNYVVANGWYCAHLWQHYRFTLDKQFLARALPAMWSACEFWIERLKKASDGTYECPNEWSPEHGPSQDGVAHAQQIVTELFANTLDAIAALGEDKCGISAQDIATLRDRYSKIDKGLNFETFSTSSGFSAYTLKDGDELLREWKYSPYTAGQNGHRHLSHLMCLHPYNQVKPGTREFKAAVNSLTQRGDGATGWSMGWKINQWARAQDGNHAHTILKNALTTGIYKNLYDSHAPFQIDGNFGATSGMAEMLLQSQNDIIHLLPALPTAWKGGSVTGLRAVGNFGVDITWAKNKLSIATITAGSNNNLVVCVKNIKNMRFNRNGSDFEPLYDEKTNTTEAIPVKKGDVITVTYDADYINTSIGTLETPAMELSVSNGQVTVEGATAVKVFDVTGRTLAAAKGSTVAVNATPGTIVIVAATAPTGTTATYKTTL